MDSSFAKSALLKRRMGVSALIAEGLGVARTSTVYAHGFGVFNGLEFVEAAYQGEGCLSFVFPGKARLG